MKARNLFIALVIVVFISMSAFAAGDKVRGRNGSSNGVGPGAGVETPPADAPVPGEPQGPQDGTGDGICDFDTTVAVSAIQDQTQQKDQAQDGTCDQTQQKDQTQDGTCDQTQQQDQDQDDTCDQTQQQDKLQDGSCCQQDCTGVCQNPVDLDDTIAADLVFVREEEKLARDVYLTLDAIYAPDGVNIFFNIASSEQKHMDAVKNLLDKYGIVDPVTDDAIGVFTDQVLQDMYDELVALGELSLVDALNVGILIEEYDIADLQECIALGVLPTDVARVYANLLAGSYNHLEAFTKVLDIISE